MFEFYGVFIAGTEVGEDEFFDVCAGCDLCCFKSGQVSMLDCFVFELAGVGAVDDEDIGMRCKGVAVFSE